MPGTSGLLSPFSKMDGSYFDASPEPDNFIFEFRDAIKELAKQKDVNHVTIECDTKEDYYKIMNLMRVFNDENLSITTSSIEDDTKIIVSEFMDMDEKAK